MAKRSGLGQKFYIVSIGSGPAYDISGDVGAIDTADCSFAALDVTGIDKSAHERIPGLGDGKLQYTGFWNNAIGGQHAVVHGMNGTPVRGIWLGSAVEGDGLAFAINGILTNYPAARAAGGMLTAKPTIEGYTGDLPDWGQLGFIGTDASGTVNHTALDMGSFGPISTISSISIANPTVITTAAPHQLTSGDSVTIAGTNSTPVANGDWVATVTGASTLTIPLNVTGSGSAGSLNKSSSRLGCTLVAALLSIGSGVNFTIKAQHSADSGVLDAWADLGVVTASLTAAAAESRIRSSGTLLVKRYVRLVSGGTYTNANAVATFKRFEGPE